MSESSNGKPHPKCSSSDKAIDLLRVDLRRTLDWHFDRLLAELNTLITFIIVIAATLIVGFMALAIVLYKGLEPLAVE